MSTEEDFYPARSELVSALISFIKLCEDNGRDLDDELNEALFEAQDECGITDKRQV